MDLFQTYETEFEELVNSIKKKTVDAAGSTGEEKRNSIRAAELEITEAIDTLEAMRLGARTLPPSHKAAAQSKIEGHEKTLQELKTDLRKAEISYGSYGSDREKLFSGASSDISVSSTDQRTRLLTATDRAMMTLDHLERANQGMDENLQIAETANVELVVQGDTIRRQRTRLEHMKENIGSANRVMRAMFKRAMTNKFLLAGVAVVIVLTIIAVLVIKFV